MKSILISLWVVLIGVTMAQAQTLTVVGQGQASGPADMASITLSVNEQDASAAVAMRAASDAMRAIFARLDAFGLPKRDRQTSNLSLDPVWANRSSGKTEPAITGYAARNQLTIRLRDLDGLGALLDAVLEDGANGFGGVRFAISDPQPLEDQARQAAVADALRTATLLAEAAGVSLGAIQSMTLGGAPNQRPPMARMEMASDAGVPVAAGEVSYAAQVTIVFELGD